MTTHGREETGFTVICALQISPDRIAFGDTWKSSTAPLLARTGVPRPGATSQAVDHTVFEIMRYLRGTLPVSQ